MSLFLIQAVSDYGSRSKMMPVFEKQKSFGVHWCFYGSGRSVVRLARLLGVQEVGSSNLPAPTILLALKTLVKLRFQPIRNSTAPKALPNIHQTFRASWSLKASRT